MTVTLMTASTGHRQTTVTYQVQVHGTIPSSDVLLVPCTQFAMPIHSQVNYLYRLLMRDYRTGTWYQTLPTYGAFWLLVPALLYPSPRTPTAFRANCAHRYDYRYDR